MKRRDFLKATLITAGGVLLGCDDDDKDGAQDRDTSGHDGADGTTDTAADLSPDTTEPDPAELADTYFPQSVVSGDPRPDSVILWTRVVDPALGADAGDLTVTLQVARDAAFTELLDLGGGMTERTLTAEAAFDHAVKVRLTGLEAGTHHYYRFWYEAADGRVATRIARTKTAPAADADVPVRFAFVSCQDYNGRYYNPYKRLLQEGELDFIVHLGDYIYETNGDPQFQDVDGDRRVVFSRPEEAIAFNTGTEDAYLAARSLSNYRDLYRIYRTDKVLQAVHEKYPMIAVWDDHEFSDDCFGATATYFDGRQDETDVARRKAANQAWFEYMPVDYLDAPEFRYDPSVEFPNDLRIYRSFGWGRHVDLVMTDLRTYRADHVIPEDANPGQVLMTQAELEAAVGTPLPDWADPYVDLDQYDATRANALRGHAATLGYSESDFSGPLSVTFLNSLITAIDDPSLEPLDPDGFERGLTAWSLNKTSRYGQLGSRYLVSAEPFFVWSAKRYVDTAGASEDTLGAAQEAWFFEQLESSSKTWKLWGTEYTLSSRQVDLSSVDTLPAAFKRKFLLSAEDWDGNPNRRDDIVRRLAALDNVVAITGDIHAFFAGTPTVSDDLDTRIVEFVTAGISSASYKTLLLRTVQSSPELLAAGAGALAAGMDSLLNNPSTGASPSLAYSNTGMQGFALVELDGTHLHTTCFQIPERHATEDLAVDALDDKFTIQRFRVAAGSAELEGEFDGAWLRWDRATRTWV